MYKTTHKLHTTSTLALSFDEQVYDSYFNTTTLSPDIVDDILIPESDIPNSTQQLHLHIKRHFSYTTPLLEGAQEKHFETQTNHTESYVKYYIEKSVQEVRRKTNRATLLTVDTNNLSSTTDYIPDNTNIRSIIDAENATSCIVNMANTLRRLGSPATAEYLSRMSGLDPLSGKVLLETSPIFKKSIQTSKSGKDAFIINSLADTVIDYWRFFCHINARKWCD